ATESFGSWPILGFASASGKKSASAIAKLNPAAPEKIFIDALYLYMFGFPCCGTAAGFAARFDGGHFRQLSFDGGAHLFAYLFIPPDPAYRHLAVRPKQNHLRHPMIVAVHVISDNFRGQESDLVIDLRQGDEGLHAFKLILVLFVVGGEAEHGEAPVAVLVIKLDDMRRVLLAVRAGRKEHVNHYDFPAQAGEFDLFLLIDDRADVVRQEVDDHFRGVAGTIGHRQFGDVLDSRSRDSRDRKQKDTTCRESADQQAEFEERLKTI